MGIGSASGATSSNISLFSLGTVSTAASFEGDDGDLANNGLTDWNDFASLTYTGTAPYQLATKTVAPWSVYAVTDARGSIDGGNDSTYAGGVKQADECPAIIATGKNASTQNKDDIARIYVAGKLDPTTGHVFLALAWVRVPQNTTSSDLHIGFEFNQSTTACGGNSASLVDRTTGDLLIVYNFQSGSASLAYSTWDDTTKSWSAETTLPPTVANAAVFGGTGSTSDLLKPAGAPNPETNEFGEAILDLTQAQINFGGNSGRACERFGRVFGESRSSGSSTTAQMEDLVGPTPIDLSNCASPTITTSASPSTATLGQSAGVKDTATLTGANAPTGNVNFQLYTDSQCTTAVSPAVTGSSGFTAGGAAGTYTANDMTAVSWTPTTAGTYYWKASYAGDGNNNGTSTCGGTGETITVPQVQPSITTSATPSTGTVGTAVNVKDTATLNSAYSPTGTVSFQLYSDSNCTSTVAGISGSSAISGTGPYTANNMTAVSWTPTAAGTYYWGASYAGDANNKSAGSCGGANETIVIAKTTPTISTTLKNASGNTTIALNSSLDLGSSVYDTSTLGNLNGVAATGTISYQFFTNGTCSSTAAHQDDNVAVGGNATTQGPLGAGNYSFRAKYVAGSDAAHTDSDWSSCEPFSVAKATPTAATTLKNAADDSTVAINTSLAINSSLYDTAQITGVSGTALSGTVTFQFFHNLTCTGTPASTQAGVALGSHSAATGPLGAGDYGFRAMYVAGADPNYNDSNWSSCEPFSIGKGTPTSATTLKNAADDSTVAINTTLPIHSSLYDTAQITAADNLALTGKVTFELYGNLTCTGTPLNTQSGVAVGTKSNATGALGAGDYGFRAMYVAGSDPNHTDSAWSSCEPFSIAKASPSIGTTLSATEVVVGSSVHDSATLTGATADAGGTVQYTVYSDSQCSTGAQNAGQVTVTNGHVPDSNPVSFPNAGTFYWQAVYSGDGNNTTATSPCTDEVLQVDSPSIAIVKDPKSQSLTAGDTAHFTITVTNTGTVTLTNVTVADGLAPNCVKTIGTLTPGQSTSYGCTLDNVLASFTNSATATGHPPVGPDVTATDTAPVTVHLAAPSIATTLSATTGAINDTVHDSSTLTGSTTDASGAATYRVYTDITCSTLAVAGTDIDAQPAAVTVTGAAVPDSPGVKFLHAGDFYWQVSYAGDQKNAPATSPCTAQDNEHLAIAKNSPTIATTLSASEIVKGSSIHDTATLTGATAHAGGTVQYTVYSDSQCSTGAQNAGQVTVQNGLVPNSNGIAFPNAGTFYWQAVYSGDADNNGATSPCTDEVLKVDSPSIAIVKNPKSQSITTGDTANFTITVTNTGDVTLTAVQVNDVLAPNCAKALGTLTPGQSQSYTCALGSVQASFTNSATATGHPPVGPDVTASDTAPVTVNQLPPPPPPPPPAPKIDLAITKVGTPNPTTVNKNITWTLTVTNNGPNNATGVTVADPIPGGTTYVSSASTQGTCTGGAVLNCSIGNVAVGQTITVTLVTTANQTGLIPNTATVVGNEAETNTANNTASASVNVVGVFKPPVTYCTAVAVSPKQLFVGKTNTLRMKLTSHGKAAAGVKVRIKGSTLYVLTKPSNRQGLVTRTVKPMKAGIVTFTPVASKRCNAPRVGVIGVFTPPVTG